MSSSSHYTPPSPAQLSVRPLTGFASVGLEVASGRSLLKGEIKDNSRVEIVAKKGELVIVSK